MFCGRGAPIYIAITPLVLCILLITGCRSAPGQSRPVFTPEMRLLDQGEVKTRNDPATQVWNMTSSGMRSITIRLVSYEHGKRHETATEQHEWLDGSSVAQQQQWKLYLTQQVDGNERDGKRLTPRFYTGFIPNTRTERTRTTGG